MIEKNDLIRGMNNAGIEVNAFLLEFVFKELGTNDEVANHNFVMTLIKKRIGEGQLEMLLKTLSQFIEDYSLRNIENVQEKTT